MKNRIFVLFALILCISSDIFAKNLQKPDYIIGDKRILEDAKDAYDNLDYSNALNLALKSKESRKDKVDWEIMTLENSFKPAEVKYVGDELSAIIPVLIERQDYDAIEIINRYFKIKEKDFYSDSAKKLLKYIKSNREFPEADFLIGNIYRLEGEYDFAKNIILQR